MAIKTSTRNELTLAEVLSQLSWGGTPVYSPYMLEMKSGPGASEKAAEANESADRADRQAETRKVDATADQYGGDPTQTGYYKRTLGMATDSTAAAFNNVRAARSAKARMAGFGYTQPIAQADDNATNVAEAQQMGDLPREVAADAGEKGLQAAQIQSGEAGMYSGSAGQNMSAWSNAESQRRAATMAMWGKLASAGVGAATGVGV